jgi:hypothetical protein
LILSNGREQSLREKIFQPVGKRFWPSSHFGFLHKTKNGSPMKSLVSNWQSVCEKFVRSVVVSGTPVSSTTKTDCHDIIERLLKVVLNTINHQTSIHFACLTIPQL